VRARTCVVSDGGADPLGAPVAVHVDLEDDGDHGQQRRLLPLLLVLRRRPPPPASAAAILLLEPSKIKPNAC
jgi:hypothetical protein